MAWPAAATATGSNTVGGGTSLGTSATVAVTAGDLIYVFAKWEGTDTTVSGSDGVNTYVDLFAGNHHSKAGADPWGTVLYAIAATTTSLTPTVNFGASQSFINLGAVILHPTVPGTISLDGTPNKGGGAGTAVNTGNITTSAQAANCGIAIASYNTFGSTTSGRLINGTAEDFSFQVAGDSSIAWFLRYTAGFTGAGAATIASNDWSAGIVAFKIVSASSVAKPRSSFPNRGTNPKNYGARLLGFKQGLSTAAVSIDIASAGALTITGAAPLTAVGTLNAAGALTITGVGAMNAIGTLASAGTLFITGSAALTSTGTLASAGTAVIVGAGALTAQGALASAGTLVINGSATLPSANDMVSAGALTITGGAALTALGTLASAASVTITGAAALTGLGSLAAAGTLVITGTADLTSTSANDIASAGSILIAGAATLSAVGTLSASGALVITGVALLDDGAPATVTATPGRRELLRNWRLPSQVRGETEDEKRLRRIEQGILPPDPIAPPPAHPTLVEEAAKAAAKARAEDAEHVARLTREVAELRADTAKYRGRSKAGTKATAARARIAQLDRDLASLHAHETQRLAAITAEESDIAFIVSVLAEVD